MFEDQGGKVDLHLHSNESDGRLTPAALVELAYRNGVRTLALTDHDTTSGLAEAFEAGQRLGVEVLAGIELSADVREGEVHMLGLLLNHEEQRFQEMLATFREARVGRAERMVKLLGELGVPISWQRVQEIAGDATVGRPHIAQVLLEAGHVQSMPEAFDRFISREGPAYAERFKLAPAEAVELVHSVQGMAVVAHPIESGNEESAIRDLAQVGLDGVECYYTGYSPEQVDGLVSLTRRYGMVPTGGSDYHGFAMSGMTEANNLPGSVDVPATVLQELRERRKKRFG